MNNPVFTIPSPFRLRCQPCQLQQKVHQGLAQKFLILFKINPTILPKHLHKFLQIILQDFLEGFLWETLPYGFLQQLFFGFILKTLQDFFLQVFLRKKSTFEYFSKKKIDNLSGIRSVSFFSNSSINHCRYSSGNFFQGFI